MLKSASERERIDIPPKVIYNKNVHLLTVVGNIPLLFPKIDLINPRRQAKKSVPLHPASGGAGGEAKKRGRKKWCMSEELKKISRSLFYLSHR